MLVIKLRGLPFEANALSIVDFFEDNVGEENIHFVADKAGGSKPHSGEAFVDCIQGKVFLLLTTTVLKLMIKK